MTPIVMSPTPVQSSPPSTVPPPASAAKRAQIEKTAQSFEASFISTMLGQMFTGTDAEAPFSGAQGESAFRSFMTDAMSKAVVKRGGVGLSKSIAAEMLKMQGLS